MCKAPKIPTPKAETPAPPPPPPNPSASTMMPAITQAGAETEGVMARKKGKSMLRIPSMEATGLSY